MALIKVTEKIPQHPVPADVSAMVREWAKGILCGWEKMISKGIGDQWKTPSPGKGYLPTSCWPGRTPRQYRLFLLLCINLPV